MGAVVNFVGYLADNLTNLVSRMGTDRDKAASSYYAVPILTDEQLLNAYRGAWLPRKIVDIPAFDSVRAWRDWQAEANQIEAIEAEERRLDVQGKVLEARIKARLWGGAAIHIGTGDQNLAEPLDVERVRKQGIRHLTVLTRRVLKAGEIDRDVESEFYGRPKVYQLTTGDKVQVDIHPSRLVIFSGNPQPDVDLIGGGDLAWGDSVLLSVMEAIKQADGTAANIASLVFEAKIDIIRVPNFMASLGKDEYQNKIINRYALANTAKGINGTLLLDKEEEYESKSANFSTLPDVLDRFLQIVSGAADIPATRLLGQSPAGMNATGESDLRNYYDRLSSEQSIIMTPAMHRMDEALIRSALGSRPTDIYYEWAPLWQMSDKEKADIFKLKADAARAIAGNGQSQPLMPIDALSDALVNAFVEDGSLPGLEAAIDEYGRLSEQEEDEVDVAAAVAPLPAPVQRMQRAANDAAPRTLYVRRDVLNRAEIVRWAKSQGFTDIVPDLHVTIAYSREPVDWFKVGTSWSEKLEIAVGGPRQIERLGEDGRYVALLITANELVWRNREIREAGASWDWPEYQPHISIQIGGDIDLSKVEPYQGRIVLGPEIFEEVKAD
ncbi:anti-CBASS protein Acb1 family protein [Chelativorans sp.]|uniref:anti-CBASS protein Acb1 family protein n=1 Tax=Chelativorans sp. TaxID=2203393 RepID=UPI002811CAE4|nr:anti-CBASS Acb1 family protein [Chelativorans sp.]